MTLIGHALFSDDKNLSPTHSHGSLCKVVLHEGVPVMLQVKITSQHYCLKLI